MNEGVVISDLDGSILHWNRAAIDMHGFASTDELLRRLPEFARVFELATLEGRIVNLEEWPLSHFFAAKGTATTSSGSDVSTRGCNRSPASPMREGW